MVVSRGETCASLDWRRDEVARRRHLVQNFDEKARAENKPRSAGERRYFEPRLPLVRGRCHRPARPHPPDSRPNSHPGRPRAHVDPRRAVLDRALRSRPISPRGKRPRRGSRREPPSPRSRGAPREAQVREHLRRPRPRLQHHLLSRGCEFALPEGPRVFTRATTHVPKLAPDPGARPATPPPRPSRLPPRGRRRRRRRLSPPSAQPPSTATHPSPGTTSPSPAEAGPVQRPEAYVGRRLLLRPRRRRRTDPSTRTPTSSWRTAPISPCTSREKNHSHEGDAAAPTTTCTSPAVATTTTKTTTKRRSSIHPPRARTRVDLRRLVRRLVRCHLGRHRARARLALGSRATRGILRASGLRLRRSARPSPSTSSLVFLRDSRPTTSTSRRRRWKTRARRHP